MRKLRMDVGTKYLLASSACAVNTLNAYRPLGRSNRATIPTMATGASTSEFPLHAIVAQLALTAYYARRRALGTVTGRAGWAVSAVSWLGLVGLHRAAMRSSVVLEHALVDEFGRDYRDRITAPRTLPIDVPLRRMHVAIPRRGPRRRCTSAQDIFYDDFSARNQLDIWRRSDLPDDARAPVLIQVHGGGWVAGRKRGQAYPLLSHLAERGWVTAAINYRRGGAALWTDHIVDVKQAMTWVKANIAEHGGDPSFVAIRGGSAGGHLAALAAVTPNRAEFQPGFEDADTSVQAAVPLYGIYDFTDHGHLVPGSTAFLARRLFGSEFGASQDVWEGASPTLQAGPDAPPCFVIHGRNDSFALVEQARGFVDALRKTSKQPIVYAELPRAQHAFEMLSSVRAMYTVRAIERFLDVMFCDRRAVDPAPSG